jgi:hypothetical protein
MSPFNGGPSQQWLLVSQRGGLTTAQNQAAGLYLDSKAGKVFLSPRSGGPSQQWTFYYTSQ